MRDFASADLKKILMNARIRNREIGVTGILVYHAGVFLQALEGEEADVRTTFDRIEKDVRHGNICILGRNTTLGKRRKFGDWSMGFADATGAAQVLKGFIEVKNALGLLGLDEARAIDILDACRKETLLLSA